MRDDRCVVTTHSRLTVEYDSDILIRGVGTKRCEIISKSLIYNIDYIEITVATFFSVGLITSLNSVELEN